MLKAHQSKLVFDSGCGSAESTARLATQFSDHLVIGIDKSEHRLRKAGPCPPNAMVLRAELVDFWRLAFRHNIIPRLHYVLYPNPWPKKHHLQRRWYGHPVFPTLLKLGQVIEIRSNWPLYCEEFRYASALLGRYGRISQICRNAPSLSPFERKYRRSGHCLSALLL